MRGLRWLVRVATLRPGLLCSARLLFRATLRRFTRFNGILPLCVLFCDQKSTRKVPLVPRRPLGGQNDGRHPAKLARSCASKPHWGFDCFATAQSRPRGLRGCEQGATVERSETGERAMFAPAGRITARAGLRSKLAALVVRRQALAPRNPKAVVEGPKS